MLASHHLTPPTLTVAVLTISQMQKLKLYAIKLASDRVKTCAQSFLSLTSLWFLHWFFVLCKFIGVRRTHSPPCIFETQVFRKSLKKLDFLIEENDKLTDSGFPPLIWLRHLLPLAPWRNVSLVSCLSHQLISLLTNQSANTWPRLGAVRTPGKMPRPCPQTSAGIRTYQSRTRGIKCQRREKSGKDL